MRKQAQLQLFFIYSPIAEKTAILRSQEVHNTIFPSTGSKVLSFVMKKYINKNRVNCVGQMGAVYLIDFE